MSPGTDHPAAPDADAVEGQGYALALVARIHAGTSTPEDMANTLGFLAPGSMLHAGLAVLLLAIRGAATGGTSDGQSGTR